jgi:2-keto-3-deoxy-L-rhamnonate aldolase RhmA
MNPVKEKLVKKQVSIGGWIEIGHPAVAEIMSQYGLDWLAIDNEHGIIDLETGMNIFNAMSGSNTVPMVRVQENNEIIIRRWCDAGAKGIIVPMVNTAEQAKQAVVSAKYPPQGKRGYGFCRANKYGANFDEYAKSANDDMLVIVQIEQLEAVNNIDAILNVDGVDGAFLGQYDLSGSMGLTGQVRHHDVLAAGDTVVRACQRHGKAAGIVVPMDPTEVSDCAHQGFTFIAAGIDTMFVRYGCERMLKMNPLK